MDKKTAIKRLLVIDDEENMRHMLSTVLGKGGYFVDTPGIRGFGVIDMKKEEIFHFFPEMFKLLDKCKYHNCTHLHEPGCAVKEALEAGEIPPTRYETYLSLMMDDDSKYRGG